MRVTEQAQFNRTVSTIKEIIQSWRLPKQDCLLDKEFSILIKMLLLQLILFIIERECHL